jgi:hypothetical protein
VADGTCDAAAGVTADMITNSSCGLGNQLVLGGAAPTCVPAGGAADARIRCDYVWTLYAFNSHTADDVRRGLQISLYAAALVPDTSDPAHPWPAGAILTPPVTAAAAAVAFTDGRPVVQQSVVWTPPRGTEGSVQTLCLVLADAGTGAFARRVCSAPVRVRRCQFCVRPGDTLKGVAQELDTDWLQLWSANVAVSDPDALAPPQTAAAAAGPQPYLNLGPVYRLSADQPLALLAATFETPYQTLLEMNPDLQALLGRGAAAVVPAGAEVCLVPMVCAGGPPIAG